MELEKYKSIFWNYSNNFENWFEKDSRGNLVRKNPQEEYDQNGNLIYFKDSDGFECWFEFNSNNKLIHSKDSDGYEFWNEYDSSGNKIHVWDSDGYEEFYE